MEYWEVYPREAAAVGMKAIEQGIARVKLTRDELIKKASDIIKKARNETDSLQEQGFIQLPEE